MKRIRFGIIFLVALVFSAALAAHAQSDKELHSKMVEPRAVHDVKSLSAGVPQTSPFTDSRQGYQMVTDVLDGFGGESESENYRIPVNSGGGPSPIGISESASFVVKSGFVLGSDVKRGDANSDGAIGAGDIVHLLNYLFRGGLSPCPMEAGDANCDGLVGAGDIVYLIGYLYRGGPPPAC
jgi:hypothetical protein